MTFSIVSSWELVTSCGMVLVGGFSAFAKNWLMSILS